MSNDASAAIEMLYAGAKLSFENAESLFNEASILRKHGANSRAYFLHQISLEECAKVDILVSATFSVNAGKEVDFDRVRKAMLSHASKNRANAYFLDHSEEELSAATGEEAVAAFNKLQKQFHEKSNDAKNSSLYVNMDEQTFSTPETSITLEMLEEISSRNRKFLSLAFELQDSLKRQMEHPEEVRKWYADFEGKLSALRSSTEKPTREQMVKLVLGILEDHLSRRGGNKDA